MPSGRSCFAHYASLHAMSRLHAVLVPPRSGFPSGFRLFFPSVRPLQRDPCREVFTTTFMEMVATLDMQVPTIIMDDFNGSVCPTRDYSKGDGIVCSMLARLLGPGGPLLGLQMAVSPNEFAPTFRSPREHQETWSRCDLVLGNRAAFTLIARVHVESGIMDGGHSPVVINIHTRPVVLNWKCPQPRVPQWLAFQLETFKNANDGKISLPRCVTVRPRCSWLLCHRTHPRKSFPLCWRMHFKKW